ncbi:MAG: MATE family efflux transporter [Lacrimispora sp.]
MSEAPKQNQITEGVIWKQLLLFFFPILFGTFFQQLYNTTDAIIVGRFVGKEALAAVGGPTGPLINLLIGFFIGLSSGAGVIISQFYGAGQEEDVSKAVHTAIAFSIVCGAVITAVCIPAAPFALKAMGTPDDILHYAVLFIRVYFIGVIPNLVYNMGAGILRAIGDSKRPLYFLIASCFTNIILDIIFVVYWHMGVAGAALATITSQLLSAVLVVLVLIRTKGACRLSLKAVRIDRDMLKRIIRIGFPAGLQSVMYSVSNIIIQTSVNTLGTDTIAAWTAYGKIDSVFWMIISAFGISITTFVGQNYGAGKTDRIYKGIRVCLVMSFAATAFLSVFLYTFGNHIYLLFTTDEAVIQKGAEILRYLVPTFFTYVLIEIYSGSLRGAGDCWIPMLLISLGVCALRVVWILVAVPFKPTIETVIFSYPLTWSTTSVLFFIYFNWFGKLKRRRIPRHHGHSMGGL